MVGCAQIAEVGAGSSTVASSPSFFSYGNGVVVSVVCAFGVRVLTELLCIEQEDVPKPPCEAQRAALLCLSGSGSRETTGRIIVEENRCAWCVCFHRGGMRVWCVSRSLVGGAFQHIDYLKDPASSLFIAGYDT